MSYTVVTDKYCKGCVYAGKAGNLLCCEYWARPGNGLRPCPGGKGCIFSPRNGGERAKHKRVRWDVDELHELYVSGMPTKDICKKTGVPKSTLGGYASRNGWSDEREQRNPGITAKLQAHKTPQWDVELARELYYAYYKRCEIADICGVGFNALAFYIDHHGWSQERKDYMNSVKDKDGKAPLGKTFALRKAVNAIAFVRQYGEQKYPNADNWVGVPMQDWADAAERHMTAWQSGEMVDAESGLPHLWHALCNLAYMVELEGK